MKTIITKLIMMAGAMLALSGIVKAQDLIWEVNVEEILADADPDLCTVRVSATRMAWVLLQSDDESKLVRISPGGEVESWELPASDAAYSIRLTETNSCLVQAASNVTRLSYEKALVEGRKKQVWIQRDAVLPELPDTVKYEASAENGESRVIWYFVTNEESAVSKIVLRKMP